MALTDESSGIPATMLVGPASVGNSAPAYPYPVYGGMGGGNQGLGGEGGWWIVLLIIVIAALGGNWGGNGNGGGAFGGQPIIVNDGGNSGYAVQRGFDQAAVMAGLTGIQSGVNSLSAQLCNCCGDIQSSLCNGFSGVNATVNGGFANAETAANARQMANMQQMFGLSTQFADCCCENRLASADLKYTIATENCADRAALSDGVRDIITNQTANTQAVLDKLCALELDGYKRENDQLRTQLSDARFAASQANQNALFAQGLTNEVDALYNRLRNCPVPSMPVYGMQPIFQCQPQQSCGCGCGNSSF